MHYFVFTSFVISFQTWLCICSSLFLNVNLTFFSCSVLFTVEVKKQSSCVVHLINKSNEYVAFKVCPQLWLSILNKSNFLLKSSSNNANGWYVMSRHWNIEYPIIHSFFLKLARLKQHLPKDTVFDQIPGLSFRGKHVNSQVCIYAHCHW